METHTAKLLLVFYTGDKEKFSIQKLRSKQSFEFAKMNVGDMLKLAKVETKIQKKP